MMEWNVLVGASDEYMHTNSIHIHDMNYHGWKNAKRDVARYQVR